MTATGESGQDRVRRHVQRTLFDGVADLYQASRPGYPAELAEFVVATAGLAAGSPVLELGCGTGQLTERLAGYGFALTATDIGPSMIAEARQRLAGQAVEFPDMTAMFTERGDFSGAWVTQAVDAGVIAGTGLFGEPVSRTQDQRISRPAATVIGVESTRASALAWPDDVRREFAGELRQYLGSRAEVPLTLRTSVTMAPVLKGP